MDISEEAIIKCKEKFGEIATFLSGTEVNVPKVDIIISSNVFEHLTDDLKIAKKTQEKLQYSLHYSYL
jgi:hypothetical protein